MPEPPSQAGNAHQTQEGRPKIDILLRLIKTSSMTSKSNQEAINDLKQASACRTNLLPLLFAESHTQISQHYNAVIEHLRGLGRHGGTVDEEQIRQMGDAAMVAHSRVARGKMQEQEIQEQRRAVEQLQADNKVLKEEIGSLKNECRELMRQVSCEITYVEDRGKRRRMG